MNYRNYFCTSLEDQKDILALLTKETSLLWASGAPLLDIRHYYDEDMGDNHNTLILDLNIGGLMYNPCPECRNKKAYLTKRGFIAFAKKHFPKN